MMGTISIWGSKKAAVIDWPRKIPVEKHLLFLESREREIQFLSEKIETKGTFEDLYNHARQWRQDIAFKTKAASRSYFGKDRREEGGILYTSLGISGGKEVIFKLNDSLTRGSKIFAIPQLELKDSIFCSYTIYGRIQRPLGEQHVKLTEIVRHEGNLEKLGLIYRVYFGNEPQRRYIWIHTPAENISIIFSEIERLYQRYLTCVDQEALLDEIARIHWWICQASPCYRGSAAISEVIIAALFKAKNFKIRLKPRVLMDVEALAEEEIERFVLNYKGFYELGFTDP
jgi:hypothetical protein